MSKDYSALLALAKQRGPKKIALVKAEDVTALPALKMACDEGLAKAVLVGEKKEIEKKLKELNFTAGIDEIIDCADASAAAMESVKMASSGKVDSLLKGALHTDILLSAVLNKDWGLRTGKMLSHVFVAQVPTYHKLLFITDAAMNIAPDLECKKHILQNAIDLAVKLGIENIKAACLGAVEDVNPKMQCTIDAACLSKMTDRGQIKGAKVDGPLAFDNAISMKAAQIKGIKSEVAGDADILLVPQIESGNILFKLIAYFIESKIGGVLVGAKCPVALSSRADSEQTKYLSVVLTLLAS